MGKGVSGTVYYTEINDGEPVAARGLAERNTPLSPDDFLKQVIVLKFRLEILVGNMLLINFILAFKLQT